MGQPQPLPEVVPPETLNEVFMPSAAWPGTGHQTDSFPPVSFTVTERVAPGAIDGTRTVDFRPAPARSSLCTILPALCTRNVKVPAFAVVAERAMWYSRSVTLIVVAAVEPRAASAAPAAPTSARTIAASTRRRMAGIRRR